MAKGKIVINLEICKGCLLCVDQCKHNAIVVSKKIGRFGNNLVEFKSDSGCNACSLCAIICPDAAIEVIKITEE